MKTATIDRAALAAVSAPVNTARSTTTPNRLVDMEISTGLLRSAACEAGLFQRSALGHLDHKTWMSRVMADGQRLTDLLWEMGFTPATSEPERKA
ncbi:hypothetical protein [Novosphingobium sp. Leaf2]|uniref:hypothetical protein n=1 Tax=Novosphingobium sp. Leaf2 TaxID=1735670 RepID=UPI0012E2E491|nr:hypothetical protein [Novosphingobium sp. Leaf2]